MLQGRRLAVLLAALSLGQVVPAAAESLVVRASGPSAKAYPAGAKLADAARITLKAGDVLTLLDGRGTRTLRGPGSFAVAGPVSAGTDSRTSLSSLLETKRVRRARTGAVRGTDGAGQPSRNPSIWYVDVSQSSTICVADPANLRLWRPDSVNAITLTATPFAGGKAGSILFGAGEATTAWPASLPVVDGAAYRLGWPGAKQAVAIRFALMNSASEGLEDTAATLIERKCDAQLDLLVETVALPDPAPASPGG
ncbi:hypothetical protein WG908_10295 [Sphingobium sp. AN641]|uniref:hypothetical protein n=1 Tax=Sphingobium sp. AN641 TaxID=3133443 RepID=UPI0030C34DAF